MKTQSKNKKKKPTARQSVQSVWIEKSSENAVAYLIQRHLWCETGMALWTANDIWKKETKKRKWRRRIGNKVHGFVHRFEITCLQHYAFIV